MKKWKKNFRRVPDSILSKVEQINSNDYIVSCAKQISLDDIKNGLYQQIGIVFNNDSIEHPDSILPSEDNGRYSKYNTNGRVIKLKHLPKKTITRTIEVPNFGDWSNGTHDITWTREVWQREFILPKLLYINIELLEQNDNVFKFKFSLDTILSKDHPSFLDDLLYHCNVLQENVGLCDIFAADSTDADYINTLYVDWELLPPGARGATAAVINTMRNPTQHDKNVIQERIEFFETLNLKNYIKGSNKFSLYFGARLENDIVILENIRYGNAIYIFKKNWEEFSQLSRTELLSIQSSDIIRVVHTNNWKNNVKRAISDES